MTTTTTFTTAADKWPLSDDKAAAAKKAIGKRVLATAKYDKDAEWYRSTAEKPVFFKAGTYTDHTDPVVRTLAAELADQGFTAGQVASALGLQYSHLGRLAMAAGRKPVKAEKAEKAAS